MHTSAVNTVLGANSAHIWIIRVGDGSLDAEGDLMLLDWQEQDRARRFWQGPLRNKYVTTHAAVRRILGLYLDVPPADVPLTASPTGKPYLIGSDLSFNLAHSGAFALCAVAPGGQTGVDLEVRRPIADADAIVRKCFSPAEAAEYRRHDRTARLDAFFRLWTRKEALLKATGEGLRRAMDHFDVGGTFRSADVIRLTDATGVERDWSMRSFTPTPGYVGALAIDREISSLQFFDWYAVAEAAAPIPLRPAAEARM